MQPIPYLFFNGTCHEAMQFYADAIEAEIVMTMPVGDGPADMKVPAEKRDWIMHGTIKVGEGLLMMSDNIMGTSDAMSGASVMLSYPTVKEAALVYAALSEGGSQEMPFEPTFWSAGFGTLTDRFGVRWMVGTDEEPTG